MTLASPDLSILRWLAPRSHAPAPMIGIACDIAPGEIRAHLSDLSTVRMHDLQHSFASFAVSDAASLLIVGRVLRYCRSSTTEIYAHLGDDPPGPRSCGPALPSPLP